MVNVDASFAPVTGGGATGVIIRDCGGDLEDFRHRRLRFMMKAICCGGTSVISSLNTAKVMQIE
jgi:hypothetical protein